MSVTVVGRHLREAAQKVLAATKLLENRQERCGECGSKHYVNITQARYYEKLMETHGKLLRAADVLDGESTLKKEPK